MTVVESQPLVISDPPPATEALRAPAESKPEPDAKPAVAPDAPRAQEPQVSSPTPKPKDPPVEPAPTADEPASARPIPVTVTAQAAPRRSTAADPEKVAFTKDLPALDSIGLRPGAPAVELGSTEPIPDLSSEPLFPVPQEDVNRFANNLCGQGRVLFITSSDWLVAISAMYRLIHHGRFEGANRRRQSTEVSVEELCADVGASARKPYLLVLNAFENKHNKLRRPHRDLLLGLIEEGFGWKDLQDALEARHKYLVVLAQLRTFESALPPHREYVGLPPHHWDIPALEAVLRRRFPDAPAALAQRLRRLLERGRPYRDEGKLIKRLERYHSQEDLAAALSRLEADEPKAVPTSADVALTTASRPVEPGPDLPVPIVRVATWVAAYMPELPADDYHRVVRVLLTGEPEPPTPPPPPPEKNAATTKDTPEAPKEPSPAPPRPPSLLERWDRGYDVIMSALGLSFRPASNELGLMGDGADVGLAVVDFDSEERAAEVDHVFRHRLVLDHIRFVRRLREAGLLFDRSAEVVDAVIKISIDLARSRPDEFGRSWLVELIRGAGPADEIQSVEVHQIGEDSIAFVVNKVPPQRWTVIYARMGDLLAAMYDHSGLRRMVDQLLDEMLAVGRDELDEAVIAIARSLRRPEFDPLRLLQTLVGRPNQEIAAKARDVLTELAEGERMMTHLRIIQTWLPGRAWRYDDDPGALLPFRRLSAELMVDLVEASMTPPRRGTPGTHPPDNFLLRRLNEPGQPETPRLLIEWLFHPLCDRVFQQRLAFHVTGLVRAWLLPSRVRRHLTEEDQQRLELSLLELWRDRILSVKEKIEPAPGHQAGRQLFQALALADWAIVLQGVGETPIPGGQQHIATLAAAVARIENGPFQRLLAFWEALEASLLLVLEVLGKTTASPSRTERQDRKEVRELLKGVRRRIRELRMKLIDLRRNERRAR